MKPIDQLGFGPKRVVTRIGTDQWEVSVTPPSITRLPTQKIVLNKDQHLGYLAWQRGQKIQDALPDLTPAQREVLMTGVGDDDFQRMFKDDE